MSAWSQPLEDAAWTTPSSMSSVSPKLGEVTLIAICSTVTVMLLWDDIYSLLRVKEFWLNLSKICFIPMNKIFHILHVPNIEVCYCFLWYIFTLGTSENGKNLRTQNFFFFRHPNVHRRIRIFLSTKISFTSPFFYEFTGAAHLTSGIRGPAW